MGLADLLRELSAAVDKIRRQKITSDPKKGFRV